MSDARDRQPDFVLEGVDEAPEFFAEGWTHLYFGYPFTKIVFHAVVDPAGPNKKEVRRATATLTMPIFVALQLAQSLLAALKANESAIGSMADSSASQIKQLLNQLPVVPAPGQAVQESQPPSPKTD